METADPTPMRMSLSIHNTDPALWEALVASMKVETPNHEPYSAATRTAWVVVKSENAEIVFFKP